MSHKEGTKLKATEALEEAKEATQERENSLKRSRGADKDDEAKPEGTQKEVNKDDEEHNEEGAKKKAKTEKLPGVEQKNEEKNEQSSENGNKTSKLAKDEVHEKPKHVFGSTTSFSSGFGVVNGGTPFSNQEKGKSKTEESPKPFSFGSGLSFGGGFGILKKSDSKAPQVEEDKVEKQTERAGTPPSDDKKENTPEVEAPPSSTEKTEVKLQKQEIKSGEESEETIFQVNAKLYQLSDLKHGWKERGVGVIKVNKNLNTGKARLVMRSRGILKVILNLPLIKGFKIQQGFPGSLQSEKFVRMTAVDDNKAPLQYALKTGKEETVQELYESVVRLIPQ